MFTLLFTLFSFYATQFVSAVESVRNVPSLQLVCRAKGLPISSCIVELPYTDLLSSAISRLTSMIPTYNRVRDRIKSFFSGPLVFCYTGHTFNCDGFENVYIQGDSAYLNICLLASRYQTVDVLDINCTFCLFPIPRRGRHQYWVRWDNDSVSLPVSNTMELPK